MKVLIVGQGGREHAIAWKLSQSPQVSRLFCAPGNPGIQQLCTLVPLAVEQIERIRDFAVAEKIDLTVIGPEVPLSLGIVDLFEAAGLTVFGPSREAARLEASKSFSKEIMREAGVPTADNIVVHTREEALSFLEKRGAPLVFKADGLAAGKGVFVSLSHDDALMAIDSLFAGGAETPVLIEQYLKGREASLIVATDGKRIVPLVPSNDYKRIGEGDTGLNTGGMGTISPTPNLTDEQYAEALERVIKPVLRVMHERAVPFRGFLYAGLMIGDAGEVNCLEFNARLGDPETQVIMRRLESDLLPILQDLAAGKESSLPSPVWKDEAAVCVVLAAHGYPGEIRKGDRIHGIEEAARIDEVVVFQAGTSAHPEGGIQTNGGRVLNVTAVGKTLEDARQRVYTACELISYEGRQFRRDIGSPGR